MIASLLALLVSFVASADPNWHLDPATVTYVTSTLIPLVTAAVTKLRTNDIVKGAVSLALSCLTAAFSTWATDSGEAVISQASLRLVVISFTTQLVAYIALYKRIGDDGINSKIAPKKGL